MIPFISPLQFNDWTARGQVKIRKIDHKRTYGTSIAQISIKIKNSNVLFLAPVPLNWVKEYLPGGELYGRK